MPDRLALDALANNAKTRPAEAAHDEAKKKKERRNWARRKEFYTAMAFNFTLN
ncbi:MAG: hypothetical protein P8H97_07360 [Pseudomonadales bacterium]|nr:hypothetical protein [Pseudomonadales bacterium]